MRRAACGVWPCGWCEGNARGTGQENQLRKAYRLRIYAVKMTQTSTAASTTTSTSYSHISAALLSTSGLLLKHALFCLSTDRQSGSSFRDGVGVLRSTFIPYTVNVLADVLLPAMSTPAVQLQPAPQCSLAARLSRVVSTSKTSSAFIFAKKSVCVVFGRYSSTPPCSGSPQQVFCRWYTVVLRCVHSLCTRGFKSVPSSASNSRLAITLQPPPSSFSPTRCCWCLVPVMCRPPSRLRNAGSTPAARRCRGQTELPTRILEWFARRVPTAV